jgi:hypothetical protein
MRQIHRLLFEPQFAHLLSCGEEEGLGFEKGTATDVERVALDDVGWDERRV